MTENKANKSNKHKVLSDARKVGELLFISGQIGINPKTGELSGEDIRSQAEQAIKNIIKLIKDNGIGLENIVKTNCYLAEINDYDDFNEVYGEHFTNLPVRTCISVKALPYNALCEIEVIASLTNTY